ncbi:MAG: hypothetical protein C6P36_04765 [Geobacillus sp.]|nr:MAG: hypothetical protein C6P36_04765 [Geobacillus sp.]
MDWRKRPLLCTRLMPERDADKWRFAVRNGWRAGDAFFFCNINWADACNRSFFIGAGRLTILMFGLKGKIST